MKKLLITVGLVVVAGLYFDLGGGEDIKKAATLKSMEVVGNVLFDSGIAIQAAKHVRLLKEKSDAPVTHIILSHSHADNIGGTQFWQEDGTEIVAHREFAEEQRYLMSLENYQWQRNRTLFPWMPENPQTNELLAYGGNNYEKDYLRSRINVTQLALGIEG